MGIRPWGTGVMKTSPKNHLLLVVLPKPRTFLQWTHYFPSLKRSNSTSSTKLCFYSLQILANPTTHLLKSLSKPSHLRQILAQMIVKNQPLEHYSFMKLLDTCISSNGFTYSALFLTKFRSFIDSHLCNSVLRSYTHLKKHWHSVFLYVQMHKHGISPDSLTFPVVIKSTAHLCCLRVGKSFHCCVVKMGFGLDLYANTALVHMYSFCSSVDDAQKMFDEMPERNSVSWNALITGYVHNKRFIEAIDLFKEMLNAGAEPGEVTMVEVLSACANLGDLDGGKCVHDYVRMNGLILNVYVGTALVDMYAKCGNLEEGYEVFRAMRVKNVCTWNVLILAYAMNGRPEDALVAFYRMTFEDYKPDDVTFLAVLSACFNQGLVGEGRSHFRSMREEFGLEPKIEHYSCMVDLLGRAGFVDEAMEMIRTMPLKPDPTIWRALLRSSQYHGNSHLTELVILKLIELEPNNGDNFLVLSNLYAQQQRWAEVGALREIMKDRGIQKIPGFSAIETNGTTNEFVVSCNLEPQFEELYELLANIYMELTPLGCAVGCEML